MLIADEKRDLVKRNNEIWRLAVHQQETTQPTALFVFHTVGGHKQQTMEFWYISDLWSKQHDKL